MQICWLRWVLFISRWFIKIIWFSWFFISLLYFDCVDVNKSCSLITLSHFIFHHQAKAFREQAASGSISDTDRRAQAAKLAMQLSEMMMGGDDDSDEEEGVDSD